MDSPSVDRRKKKDKAKEKFERTGGLTKRHVREKEALLEKRVQVQQAHQSVGNQRKK